jgi:hypothetical protein
LCFHPIVGNNQTVCEKTLPSPPIIPNLVFGVKEGIKDGMDYRVLIISMKSFTIG